MKYIYGCDKQGYVDENGNRDCDQVCEWKMSHGKCGYLKEVTETFNPELKLDTF